MQAYKFGSRGERLPAIPSEASAIVLDAPPMRSLISSKPALAAVSRDRHTYCVNVRVPTRRHQGVDVWINTPRRPWEACGTSGMKVLVNGDINLSELDGWWAEAYSPEVGWALGDVLEHGDAPALDGVEANALYELLERQVVPEFYARDASGIPRGWVKRMRESMGKLTPLFSTSRTVREYAEGQYLPAAAAYRKRAADKGAGGRDIVRWKEATNEKWSALRLGEVKAQSRGDEHLLEVPVFLGDLDPAAVRVELYADGIAGKEPVRQEMKRARPADGASGRFVYSATVAAVRPAADYTVRILPRYDGLAVPLECSRILWQR